MERYSSYKDSGIYFIPQIPQGWDMKRAKFLFNEEKRAVRPEDEIVTCFRDGQVTLRKNRRTEGFTTSLKEFGYQGVRKGDLVIHNMDAFAGSIGVSDSDGKGTPVYSCCTPLSDNVNQYYYCYLLRSLARDGFILSLAKGIRERSTDFRFNDFKELYLPLPPRKEQDKMVEFIDRATAQLDAAIAREQQMIDLLNERKRIIIQQAVTKGLDPNAKLKPSGVEWLGDVPEGWEVNKIKTVASLAGRIGFRGYSQSDLVDEGEGAITLSPSNMMDGGALDYTSCSYLSWRKYYESPEIMVEKGDILFVKTGSTYGKVSFVEELPMEATINPQIVLFKNINCNSKFLFYCLTTDVIQSQVAITVGGSTIPTLAQKSILNYLIPMPSLEEQNKIVEFLDHYSTVFDKTLRPHQQRISLLQERKQILISEVVTGKIKVS